MGQKKKKLIGAVSILAVILVAAALFSDNIMNAVIASIKSRTVSNGWKRCY